MQTLYRKVLFTCEKGKFFKKAEGEALLQQVTDHPFVIVSFQKKKGKESPPRLFDLTSLQVHCNKRFAYSADQTLQLVQKLYEQKVVTYPRVDTTYLPNDVYPKVPGILQKMQQYQPFIQPLLGTSIRKTAKVFNDQKVTDHHAIIPTGFEKNLPPNEQNVYDAIARRFIAAFYPDCIVAKTTVIGEVEEVRFKATGKEILEEGWRVLFPKPKTRKPSSSTKSDKKEEEERILPRFEEGESGPHTPSLAEKQTQPPKNYTEATLLRAMETAGKKVDDEALRELMKANGIGRPSTRANIIETLFKRRYIQRKRKLIIPTEMGIQLIDTIQNNLLKSAELTGQWEKQLRDIEQGKYSAKQFVGDMKAMVSNLIDEVRQERHRPRIAAAQISARSHRSNKTVTPKSSTQKSVSKSIDWSTQVCPKCQRGQLLKGKTAYGCSRWKEGCAFRLPFVFRGKKIPERQLQRLLARGSTIQLRGFKEGPAAGKLYLDDQSNVQFQEKSVKAAKKQSSKSEEVRTKKKPTAP
ncbi:MAG: DNA topoisomerase, partial [Bacteroidota bacterium]